jgi:hypothetical protein
LGINGIEALIQRLEGTVLVSETDVRTQVAVPLLDLLGYPSTNRAEEFPIYGFEGRKPLRAKPADIVLFNSTEHSEHLRPRTRWPWSGRPASGQKYGRTEGWPDRAGVSSLEAPAHSHAWGI